MMLNIKTNCRENSLVTFRTISTLSGQSGVLPCMGIVRLSPRFTLFFPYIETFRPLRSLILSIFKYLQIYFSSD